MKKVITAFVLAAQLAAATVPVFAAEPTVSYKYDADTMRLSVKLDTGDGADGKINFVLYDSDGVFSALKELSANNGQSEFSAVVPKGTYTLKAKVQESGETVEKTLTLSDAADEALKEAIRAAIAEGGAAIDKVALDNADYLQTVYTEGAGELMADSADISENPTEFAALYNKYAAVAVVNKAEDAAGVMHVLGSEKLAGALELDAKLPETGGKNAYTYASDTVKEKAGEKLSQKSDYKTPDELTDDIALKVLLASLKYGSDAERAAQLETYINAQLVKASLADYNKLSETQKRTVIEKMKADFETYAAVGSAFDGYVKQMSDSTKNKTSGGSGGGGGGGGSSITVGGGSSQETVAQQPAQSPGPQYIFDDMESAKWAYEAVECLYRRGVISGNGEGKYEPGRRVTRAEFTKMLMCLTGAENSGDAALPFEDISPDDWSYKYISAAYKNGVVYGLTDREFGKNEFVTREQAAVFVSRALDRLEQEKPDPGYNVFVEFDDIADAADWAQESVTYLLRISMIKGKENKNFKPKDYLTRAEAASMFYSYLVVMGREGK